MVPGSRARLWLAVLLATCFTGGCSANHASPRAVGTLVMGQQQEPLSLNPALENGQRSTQWGELLFSYLVKYNDKGELIGDVAIVVPSLKNGGISRDGTTIVYRLRHDVRFADGVSLTARDCVWSINAINNPDNNVQSRYGYDRIASARAYGDYTLVLRLRKPFAPVLSLVLAPQGFPILPAHLLAKYPNFNHLDFNSRPIGSGPYVVERWLHGDRVELRTNAYYFGAKPKIGRFTMRFVPSPQTGTDQLRTGELQSYFNEQDYSQYPQLKSLAGYYVLDTPVSAIGAIIFNTGRVPTNDARVRHALAEAIDIHAIVAKAYRGALDSRHAGRGLFIWSYDSTAYPDVPYDAAHARTLLDDAGWRSSHDGYRYRNGRILSVLLIIQAATPGEAIAANSIAQYEHAVGVQVAIKQFNVTQFAAPLDLGGPVYGGKFDMALYSFVNGDDPDTTDQFACANVPPRGYNKSRICDPRLDALLAAGRSTYSVAERTSLYKRLQFVLYADLPIVPIYQRREIDVFPNAVKGPNGSIDTVFWNVAHWKLLL